MRFGEHFLEELKARLRPSDVIGRHVKLKRQGREYAGLSPFTNEKTPSFFVNDEKGFYHCFSSGKHGDIIGFLMDVEGLSFPESVEKLANMAGLPLPKADPEAERRAEENKKTINWMEEAQAFFAASLRREHGLDARDYLKGRGLNGDDAKRFGLGFAPDSFSGLKDYMIQKGASMDVLIDAGLLIEPDDKSRDPWDRFRNRIMFPIHDPRGRLVAFGGRAMEKGAKAKYLNSPETSIFHKGRVLYHYPEARRALSNPKNGARGLIVAEGYMDVIALAKAGFDHAVAPLGTALTEDQLDLLWRAGPEPVLCFDGDKAGLRAAYRSVERAIPKLKPGQTLRFALLPDGKDPDDLIRAEGAGAMQKVLDRALPMIDMLWQQLVEAEPLDTPEARAGLKDRIFAQLRNFTHDGVRDQYRTILLEKFDQAYGRRRVSGGRGRQPVKTVTSAQKMTMGSDALRTARETRVLGAVLEWPNLLERIDQQLFALNFATEGYEALQTALLSYWRSVNSVEKSALESHIEAQGLDKLLRKLQRNRPLTVAAMGGIDAEPEKRLALWIEEAEALTGQLSRERVRSDTRSRLAETIREDNAEAMKKLMRTSRQSPNG